MATFAVILPAAGNSTRFGGPIKKPFLALRDRPIWLRSCELFLNRPDVKQILLVVSPGDREEFVGKYAGNLTFMDVELVEGGSERFESVANAIARVDDDVDFIAVHDAVRPLTTAALIDRVLARATEEGAALPAVALTNTLKRVDSEMRVTDTPSREGLWMAQTPQVGRREWMASAYAERAELPGPITDDAQLLSAAGHPVTVVPGDPTNIKITTPEDLWLAGAILTARETPEPEQKSRRPFDDEWE